MMFICQITGYLSGPSPHIKSGVVSVLSVLVYHDPHICTKMPDLFPTVMELLHSKAIEVIKVSFHCHRHETVNDFLFADEELHFN